MRNDFVEGMEARTFLAGVTLLSHGWNGGLGGWLEATANGISARLGGNSQVPRYILHVRPNNNGVLFGSIEHVNGTAFPDNNGHGEIILITDWTTISTDTHYSLRNIGDVIGDYMTSQTVDGIRLASLPIHAVSLSRGTGAIDEIARALGERGVWVDQETYCDPFPLINEMGDNFETIYDNVEFVDNYWRTDH